MGVKIGLGFSLYFLNFPPLSGHIFMILYHIIKISINKLKLKNHFHISNLYISFLGSKELKNGFLSFLPT